MQHDHRRLVSAKIVKRRGKWPPYTWVAQYHTWRVTNAGRTLKARLVVRGPKWYSKEIYAQYELCQYLVHRQKVNHSTGMLRKITESPHAVWTPAVLERVIDTRTKYEPM